MRLIPKKTKVNATVFRSFTLFDILLAFALFIIAFLIIMSNINAKWAILVAFASFSIILFFPSDDGRAYCDMVNIIKYISSRKKFYVDAKRRRSDISQLIPFIRIEPNGVVDYGEYQAVVLSVGCVEFGLLNAFEQNKRITTIAKLFSNLSESTVIQIVKVDRPINYDAVSEKLYAKIKAAEGDQTRDSAKIEILKSRLAQIDEINNVEQQFRPYFYIVIFDSDGEVLRQTVDFARESLIDAGLESEMLEQKDAAVFLRYTYTRDFEERDIEDINELDFMKYVAPQSVRFTNSAAMIDGVYSCTFAIRDYPLAVGNAWGANLFNIDNTKVVMTIRPVDKIKAIKRIDRTIVEMGTRHESGKASETMATATHIETMGELLSNLQNESEALLDCTLTVTGYNFSDEKNIAFRKKLRREIMSSGFSISALRGRQFEGFVAGSISRRSGLRTYERGINSESVAAVFPFVFTSLIEPEGCLLGQDYYPVIIDIWKRNYEYTNSNMMVLGKSGAGKSFFAKLLFSMLYSEPTRLFILDPENEYGTLCRNVGGKFIDVGNATTGRVNPLHIYQILTEDGSPAPSDIVFYSHLRFLESFFKLTLPGITYDSLELLNNLVADVYVACGITENTDCSNFSPEAFPTFDDLLSVVAQALESEQNTRRKDDLLRLETYVKKFARGGRYSNLWNGASTLTSEERFVVFNFQSLLESKNNIVSNAQMLVIMRYLEQQIINIREYNRTASVPIHPIVGLDEGYNFINKEYPIALDFVFQWFKRIRKYDGSMLFMTQNLSDILETPEIVSKTSAIINNSQYSFVFSLAPKDAAILTDLYRNAGEINETEQNEITSAGVGKCFLISSPQHRTSFNVVAAETVKIMFERENASNILV